MHRQHCKILQPSCAGGPVPLVVQIITNPCCVFSENTHKISIHRCLYPNSSLSHMEIFSHASPLKIQLILPPFMGSLVPSTYYLLQWPLMIDTQGCLSCSLKIAILSSLTLSSLALQHSARHSNMFKKWSLQEKKWIGRPDLIQGSLQIPPAGLAWRQEVYGPRRASRSHE